MGDNHCIADEFCSAAVPAAAFLFFEHGAESRRKKPRAWRTVPLLKLSIAWRFTCDSQDKAEQTEVYLYQFGLNCSLRCRRNFRICSRRRWAS